MDSKLIVKNELPREKLSTLLPVRKEEDNELGLCVAPHFGVKGRTQENECADH